MKLRGIVDRVTYHNDVSGWSVLRVSSYDHPGETITVTVHQTKVFAGATVEFHGEWVRHPKFGQQFKAIQAIEQRPSDVAALEKYLGSGLIAGVGPKTAKKIVKYFGKETLDIFEQSIDRLMEIEGIAKKKLQTIQSSWSEHKEIRNVMLFLQGHGISTLFAVKIFKTYGQDSIRRVQENPYQLSRDIYGIGFLSADKIAKSLGIGERSPVRLMAAIRHVLSAAREMGHCYLTFEQVKSDVSKLLQLEFEEREITALMEELESKQEIKVKIRNISNEKCFYSRSLYFDECYVEEWVCERIEGKFNVDKVRIERWLSKYNGQQKYPLSEEQLTAVAGMSSSTFSILTGGPGCGKTTTTKTLVKLFQAMQKKILLAAPTGRAAQRMAEVIGLEVKTIHRLLEWEPHGAKFKRDEYNPLNADVLIVDETSMLDISLCASLLKATASKMQVIFIGDPDQLPSVGPGNVLADLIKSGIVPCYRLTQVFRQGKESLIIKYAHEINRGVTPEPQSPFEFPEIWKKEVDVLFIDAEEATLGDVQFLKKLKDWDARRELTLSDNDDDIFELPKKYQHVDIQKILESPTETQQLLNTLKKIHPWSCLYWGNTAVDMLKMLYTSIIPKYDGKNCEIQILSPMLRGSMGTSKLNEQIQKHHNPPDNLKSEVVLGGRIFRLGDRVIQRRNNYDLNVFNGDIGYIVDCDPMNQRLAVDFTAGAEKNLVWYERENIIELDLAYAITIHKSQGSEFDCVIIPVFGQHFKMLFRNLIYTAITRAKKRVVFIGSRRALGMAIKNVNLDSRQTLLLKNND